MNYCIHLKKRKNKPYCKLLDREITLSECNSINSENKCREYKTKNEENPLYKNKKCTEFKKNSAKKSTLKGKSPVKSGTMKNKSKKLAKLECERYSVFTAEDKCFVCGSTYLLTWNEIYRGKNRQNSMEDGFCLRMCLTCHRKYQDDVAFNDFWHRKAQLYYEQNIGDRKHFLARYRRNYLE